MSKPSVDLLYVEDIAPFNLVQSPQNPERVIFNYRQLAARGVAIERESCTS